MVFLSLNLFYLRWLFLWQLLFYQNLNICLAYYLLDLHYSFLVLIYLYKNNCLLCFFLIFLLKIFLMVSKNTWLRISRAIHEIYDIVIFSTWLYIFIETVGYAFPGLIILGHNKPSHAGPVYYSLKCTRIYNKMSGIGSFSKDHNLCRHVAKHIQDMKNL